MTLRRLSHLLAIGAAMLWLPAAEPAFAQGEATADSLSGGSHAYRRGDTEGRLSVEEKIALLNDKLAGNPLDGASWNNLGVLLSSQSDFPGARDAFIHAVQCDRENGDFHRNLGLVFARLEMPEMALTEFNEYRRLDQFGGKDFWLLIGGAQRQAGQVADARRTFRDGLKELGTPPGTETFRLVLALKELETAEADEQAVHDLLEEWAPVAAAFLDSTSGTAAGSQDATTILQSRVVSMIDDAKAMELSGLDAEALALYSAAYELDPARPDLLPRLVDVHLRLGRTADAEAAAAEARRTHPEWTSTWLASAKVHEQAGRLEEALVAYKKTWGIEPLDGLRLAIGTLYLRMERNQEAADWLRAGLAADPRPEYTYYYALALVRGGKCPEAIPPLRKVVAERPDMIQAWQSLAQCLQATEQFAEAIEPYERMFALQPDPKTAFLVGSMAQRAKQTDRAVAAYKQSLELDPAFEKAQLNLAICYLEAKRYEEAAPAFARLIELEEPNYRSFYNLGLCNYFLENYEVALENFKGALALEKTVNVLNGIGLVLDKMDNKVEAASWYEQAKDLEVELKKKKG